MAGDRLFVTGHIGDGAIGLKARLAARAGDAWPLGPDHRAYLDDRYLAPRPRNAIAAALRRHAHAAMDVSDGFVGDLTKMLGLARLGAEVRLDDVPLSVAARAAIRRDPALLDVALTGGDDYEVLASVPAGATKAFLAECLAAGVPAVEVGVVGAAAGAVRFLNADGGERRFARGSYVHGR
jgi:thiamine-monophosphate kinase